MRRLRIDADLYFNESVLVLTQSSNSTPSFPGLKHSSCLSQEMGTVLSILSSEMSCHSSPSSSDTQFIFFLLKKIFIAAVLFSFPRHVLQLVMAVNSPSLCRMPTVPFLYNFHGNVQMLTIVHQCGPPVLAAWFFQC